MATSYKYMVAISGTFVQETLDHTKIFIHMKITLAMTVLYTTDRINIFIQRLWKPKWALLRSVELHHFDWNMEAYELGIFCWPSSGPFLFNMTVITELIAVSSLTDFVSVTKIGACSIIWSYTTADVFLVTDHRNEIVWLKSSYRPNILFVLSNPWLRKL